MLGPVKVGRVTILNSLITRLQSQALESIVGLLCLGVRIDNGHIVACSSLHIYIHKHIYVYMYVYTSQLITCNRASRKLTDNRVDVG